MARPKRVAKHVPEFPPLDQLQIGDAFNPYEVFVYGEVLRKVLRFGGLNDGQKTLWILLADQCQKRGFDTHSQTELAAMLAWKIRKLKRNIRELKKLKLVHVEWNLGEPARTWLLFHPVFALCSPRGSVKNDPTLGQIWPKGSVKNGPNMDLPHGSFHGRGDTTFVVGTSNRGTSDAGAEDKANKQEPKNTPQRQPITNRVETLQVSAEAKSFWFALPPREKQIRLERAAVAAERVTHYQQYIEHTDHTIAGQARREVKRYLDNVRSLGFFMPGIEPKGKK